MLTMLRTAFTPRMWSPRDLDDLSDFWVTLFEVKAPGRIRYGRQKIELRIEGYPKFERDSLASEVLTRLRNESFRIVPSSDPCCLCVSTDWFSLPDMPVDGLGFPLLVGSRVEGLMIELRITVKCRGQFLECKPIRSSLVVRGSFECGYFRVFALWRTGREQDWEDVNYPSIAWPLEAEFLNEFDRGRENGWLDSKALKSLARQVYLDEKADRSTSWNVWLVNPPSVVLGSRLNGFLKRLTVHATLLTLLVCVVTYLVFRDFWLESLLISVVGLLEVLWFTMFARICIQHYFQLYFRSKQRFQSLYSEPRKSILFSPEEQTLRLDSIFAKRSEAELNALGFSPFGRFRINHPSVDGNIYSVYRSADGESFAILMVIHILKDETGRNLHEVWPPQTVIMFVSVYPNNGFVTTCGDYGLAFLAKRSGPEVSTKYLPQYTEPDRLFQAHESHRKQYAMQMAVVPQRIVSVADFLRLCDESHEQNRQLYILRPITLTDRASAS